MHTAEAFALAQIKPYSYWDGKDPLPKSALDQFHQEMRGVFERNSLDFDDPAIRRAAIATLVLATDWIRRVLTHPDNMVNPVRMLGSLAAEFHHMELVGELPPLVVAEEEA